MERGRAWRLARGRCLEGAGYERIETPDVRGHGAVRAGGGGLDGHRAQGDVLRSRTAAGARFTLRPEGTAPVCRASIVEHGMHKLQPAGEAVVPVELLPLRARPGGAPAAVLAGRRGGAGLSRSPTVDAESIVLLAALLEELGVGRRAAASLQPGGPRAPGRSTASACRPTCARTKRSWRRRCGSGSS